jgi:hypothetical protein
MDPKGISAFLAPPKMTFREILLSCTGAAIGLLLVTSASSFYKHDPRHGIWLSLAAFVLALGFFRKRKLALVFTSLGPILGLASLGLPFHPSLPGLLLVLGCFGGIYFAAWWSQKKYPYLSFRSMHALFDGEAALAAENARIEAEARELVKKRPFGPWLFR